MKFELRCTDVETWQWQVVAKDEVVAVGPDSYDSEKDARSAIARARKAFAGYRFAKVAISSDSMV